MWLKYPKHPKHLDEILNLCYAILDETWVHDAEIAKGQLYNVKDLSTLYRLTLDSFIKRFYLL